MPDSNGQKGGLSWSAPEEKPAASPAKNAAPASAPKQPVLVPHTKTAATKSANTSAIPTYAGLIIGGIIVGVLVAWGWSALPAKAPVADTASTTTQGSATTNNSTATSGNSQPMPTSGGDSSFSVANPQSPGTSVALSSVRVTSPTWFVVYESRDGKPGNVLGAALIFPDQKSATIELIRGTTSASTYFVGKRADDGDRLFELETDDPVRAGGASATVTEFRTL